MADVIAKGIDVSKHQGTINWEKVKAAGIQYAIIRAGYGRNNIDPQFKRNISECNRLGIPCGIFWASYALNVAEAKKEAEYCLQAIAPYTVEYPVYFDLEYFTADYMAENGITLTKAMATQHAEAFLEAIEDAGYYAGLYANPDYLSRFFEASLLDKYDLWLANFRENADTSSPPRSCGMWQHWNKGSVNGISEKVDLDVSYKDYPEIIRGAGLNGLSAAEPAPEPKWEKTAAGWTYGDYKNRWGKLGGLWYWFDGDGIAVTGWQEIKGVWYYFLTAEDAEKTGGKECSCYSLDKSE